MRYLAHLQISTQAGEKRRKVEPSIAMELRLRRRPAEEDIGRLIGCCLRAFTVVDHRPNHVAHYRANGRIGLIDLRSQTGIVARNGEADDVRSGGLL